MTLYAEDLEKYYEIGKEIVAYEDIPYFAEKISYYLAHDEKREAIAEAGLCYNQGMETPLSRGVNLCREAKIFLFFVAVGLSVLLLPHSSSAAQFPVDSNGTLTNDLVAYYKLENASDTLGTHDLANNGIGFSAGKVNNAADAGSGNTNKTLSVSNDLGIDGGPITIAMWVKLTDTISSVKTFGGQESNGGSNTGYEFEYNGTTLTANRFKNGLSDNTATETVSLDTDTWHFLVLTYDGTTLRLYRDNVAKGTLATGGNGISGTNPRFKLFDNPVCGDCRNFSGKIDEVGVWNRVLTTSEIADLWNGGAGQTMVDYLPPLSSLEQYKSDGTTPLASDGITTNSTVVLKAQLDSAGTSTLQLQVEVKPAGTDFDGTPSATSIPVASGTVATAAFQGANGSYHWRARATNQNGATSTWQLFGSDASSTDFIIDAPGGGIDPIHFQYDPEDTLTNGLVAYYKLENASDTWGTYHLANNNGIGFSAGKVNNAADAGSGNTNKTLNTGSDLGINGGPITIAMWVKLTDAISSVKTFGGQTANGGSNTGYEFEYNGTTLTANRFKNGTNDYTVADTVSLGTDTWHFLVLTYDGATLRLYRDDEAKGTLDTGGNGVSATTPKFQLFDNPVCGDCRNFSGKIDEAGVWNRALTQDEISDLWRNGNGQTLVRGSPTNFYAEIKNTTNGGWLLRSTFATSTASNFLKRLPEDWIVHVSSTANATTSGGYTWYDVVDPTDGVEGWMAASSSGATHLAYSTGTDQSSLEASSSLATTGYVATSSRPAMIIGAIDHYYNDTNTSFSLYSSDDGSNDLSIFSDRNYPEQIIGGIAAVENSTYNDPVFDNEVISYDYGHGIMQLTAKATSTDIKFLQILLNRDPDTALDVASGTDGSPGHENDNFGPATKDAVIHFQEKYSISPASGTVGYYTRQQLNSFLPTSSIPSDFTFQELLSTTANNPDRTSFPFDKRGEATGMAIPPCDTLGGYSGTNYFKNCYANSPDTTHKHYASDSEYSNQVFKYYTNTSQSIYANIKDGMEDLASKYTTQNKICDATTTPLTVGSTTYSCTDREIILVTASYNGTSSYLAAVATDTANIAHFFSGQDSSGLSDIINKMYLASDGSIYAQLHSPGDLSIQDNYGHVIGVVNGIAENTFPFASYDPDTKSAHIFFPQSNLTYKVKGTGSGVYGLDITVTSGTQQVAFHRDENVPITPGEVHTYTIDANAIIHGKSSVTFKIDNKGNGTVNNIETLDASSTVVAIPQLLPFSGIRGNGRFYFPPAPPKPVTPIVIPAPVQFSASTSTINFVTSTIDFSTSTINSETTSSTANVASSTLQISTSSTDINSSTQN